MKKIIVLVVSVLKVCLLLLLIFVNGCGKGAIKEGNKVTLHYKTWKADGEMFDESKETRPLAFTVGKGQVPSYFEKEVMGMKVNEEKKFVLKPEDAYGQRDESLIKEYPKTALPKGRNYEVGNIIKLQGAEDGQIRQAAVIEVTENSIKIDMNHPLAGMELTYYIKILRIE